MSNVVKFRRRRKPSKAPVVLAAAAIIGVAGGLASLSMPDRAAAKDEIFRTFTLCHTGGGTNCVVDGDTIWLDGEKIRVADIDTPETRGPKCPSEGELGEKATRRLHQLLGDQLVSEGLARTWTGRREPWC